MPVVVHGVRELSASFGRVSKEFPKHVRKRLKDAAEPVRAQAQVNAGQQVRNLGGGDPWTGMRTGGGVKVVYIAPKQRGKTSRQNPRKRRPNLKNVLLRAMQTAGDQKQDEVRRRLEGALNDGLRDFNG